MTDIKKIYGVDLKHKLPHGGEQMIVLRIIKTGTRRQKRGRKKRYSEDCRCKTEKGAEEQRR